jgi:hypothetical protein
MTSFETKTDNTRKLQSEQQHSLALHFIDNQQQHTQLCLCTMTSLLYSPVPDSWDIGHVLSY